MKRISLILLLTFSGCTTPKPKIWSHEIYELSICMNETDPWCFQQDYNDDGVVDLKDYSELQRRIKWWWIIEPFFISDLSAFIKCMGVYEGECYIFDYKYNGSIDMRDFAYMQRNIRYGN